MNTSKYQLVLARHGHTEWNLNNRFTGWSDVPLSKTGINESTQAGTQLAAEGYTFDEAHISVLMRTRQALDAILKSADHPAIPVYTSWRLNERHYGNLQGLNKQEIFDTWGQEQSYRWWRGYHDAPPSLESNDPRHPCFDDLYNMLDPTLLPDTESLAQCRARLLPYWNETLLPRIQAGKRIIVVSHGNTLRGLRMYLENINPADIEAIEIPLGAPFVYHFDADMNILKIEHLEYDHCSA